MFDGLFRLIAYGAQDIYLTAPKITFFNVVYKKAKNFEAQEILEEQCFGDFQQYDKYNQRECAICLDKFGSEEFVSVRKCGHIYHNTCHDRSMRCCPVCRQ